MSGQDDKGFVDLTVAGRALRLEVAWVGPEPVRAELVEAQAQDAPALRRSAFGLDAQGERGEAQPLVVFLHEGLGSVSMWRDFPARLCQAVGARGLVYSRAGYGRSTPRAAHERWTPRFMHDEAQAALRALLAALGIDGARQPLWLFGHSDGGSIALLHAARPAVPLAGVIVLAPHLFVEEISVASIAKAREAYLAGDLRVRLAKHHADVDSAFFGWNDIWLDPAFRAWNIEHDIAGIACPVLAMQGIDDEYGTLEQIRAIPRSIEHGEVHVEDHGEARRRRDIRLLEIPDCGHSPHRDQPATVIDAVAAFMRADARR